MIDRDDAREALGTVRARQEQAYEIATGRAFPWWYLCGFSVATLGLSAFVDLRALDPGLDSWIYRYAVPAVFVILVVALGAAASRAAGIRLRGRAGVSFSTRLWGLLGLLLVVSMVVGTVLRFADLTWSQTIGTACALAVTLPVGAAWLRPRRRG